MLKKTSAIVISLVLIHCTLFGKSKKKNHYDVELKNKSFTESLKIIPHVPFPINDVKWYKNSKITKLPEKINTSDRNWRTIRWLVRTKLQFRPNEKNKYNTFYGKFNMPAKQLQGMTIKADGPIEKLEIVCNGKNIRGKAGTHIYALPLVKGENNLVIHLVTQNPQAAPKKPKKKKRRRAPKISLFLTPVDLEYTYPTSSNKLAALWRSVNFLGTKYNNYPTKALQKEIKSLYSHLNDKDIAEKIKNLQIKALIKKNPVIDFDKILVRTGKGFNPCNWHGNTQLRRNGWGNSIAVLSLKDFSVKDLYRPKNNGSAPVADICLSFDAKKLMFSSVSDKDKTWQVYEMNVDGSKLRQVTRDDGRDIDNYNGVYLPNGKFIFCSTANMAGVPCVSGNADVGTFYTANMDGSDVRQLTFEQDADWYPWVMDDGKIMYLRWEYTDNSHYFTRILMTMLPDGTRQRSIYGSGSYWPNTMFSAKTIPGSNSKFTAVCSGHHGVSRAGEIVLFDANKGDKNVQGAIQKLPGYKQKVPNIIRDQYAVGVYPNFYQVWPISDEYFLASGIIAPDKPRGLFLLDKFDNVVMLKEGNVYEPVPLKPRKMPRVAPSAVNTKAKDATLVIQDIYEGPGLKNIPRGTVKSLRLFTYSYGYRKNGGHHQLAIEGGWDCKRLLGTVPVEADGSVMVKVPHSTPISIQPLDKNGQSLQYFRSWLVAMPGESLSCVGCHEPSNAAPLQRVGKAMMKAPKKLQPWDKYKLHGFGFIEEVQPLLDRRCVGCHNANTPGRPDFKTLTKERGFSVSYHSLHKYVRRPGPESDFEILNPMEFHSSTSEIVQMLQKGHHGVKLNKDDWKILYTWIDLNVPYYATWTDCKGSNRIDHVSARAAELRLKYAGIDDNPEWMPPIKRTRSAFQMPEGTVKAKTPAPKVANWPFKAKKNATKTINLGDNIKIILRKIPAGKFAMGSNTGEEDERPINKVTIKKSFWMADSEITNAMFAKFDPKHDSRFIDQQWKDHIYQGYPANKPYMPAIRVSWQEAMDFCKWLSKKTGKKVTLPTEAQWEWAARAGTNTPSWFNNKNYAKYENMADHSIGLLAVRGVDPRPISEHSRTSLNDFVPRDKDVKDGRLLADSTKQYLPNPWGLYDMLGNIKEWTRSDYLPYPFKQNCTKDANKVVRGGSWRTRAKLSTASYRTNYKPYQKVFDVGFRIIIEE